MGYKGYLLDTEAIVRTFSPLWRSKNGFKVQITEEHTMLFVSITRKR